MDSQKMALSVREVSELLGLGRTAVYEAVRNGQMPSIKVGSRILVPRAALEAMLRTTDSNAS